MCARPSADLEAVKNSTVKNVTARTPSLYYGNVERQLENKNFEFWDIFRKNV